MLLVTRPDPQCGKADVQRAGARAHRHGVPHLEVLGAPDGDMPICAKRHEKRRAPTSAVQVMDKA